MKNLLPFLSDLSELKNQFGSLMRSALGVNWRRFFLSSPLVQLATRQWLAGVLLCGHDTPRGPISLGSHPSPYESLGRTQDSINHGRRAASRKSLSFSFFHPRSSQRNPFACENDKNAAATAECK